MCDQGQSSKLLALPFAGMKEELERQLEFRAWNSDPRASPSYPCLLYSLLVSRGDYRKGVLPARALNLRKMLMSVWMQRPLPCIRMQEDLDRSI